MDASVAAAHAEIAESVTHYFVSRGIAPGQADLADPAFKDTMAEILRLLAVFESNGVDVYDDVHGRVIGQGLYLSLSLFNHSCTPNCVVSFEGACASVYAVRAIDKDEELTISYIDHSLPRVHRWAQLLRRYRFPSTVPSQMATLTELLLLLLLLPSRRSGPGPGPLAGSSASADAARARR
jgi:hypothetical protein